MPLPKQLFKVKLLAITSSLTMGVFGTVKELVQASFFERMTEVSTSATIIGTRATGVLV